MVDAPVDAMQVDDESDDGGRPSETMTMSENNPLTRRRVLRNGAMVAGLSVVGSVAMSGTVAAGIGEDRVGHYPLNNLKEERENEVHDASPEDNHGDNNGATVVRGDGQVGNAFAFNGDNTTSPHSGDWIDVNETLLDGATTATVAGWFNANTVDTAGGVFGHRPALNAEKGGLTFRVNSALFSGHPDGSVELIVNGWQGKAVEVPFDYDDGTWHHLAGVYDGNAAKVYIDGMMEGSANYSKALDPYPHFEIGRYKWADQGDEWYYDGEIDEVRVYNRVLSESEIESLATMGGE